MKLWHMIVHVFVIMHFQGGRDTGVMIQSPLAISRKQEKEYSLFSVCTDVGEDIQLQEPGNIESIQNCFTAMACLCISVVPFTANVQRSETFSVCKRARLNLQREISIDRRNFQTQILPLGIYVSF
jgi:hypothetical protein